MCDSQSCAEVMHIRHSGMRHIRRCVVPNGQFLRCPTSPDFEHRDEEHLFGIFVCCPQEGAYVRCTCMELGELRSVAKTACHGGGNSSERLYASGRKGVSTKRGAYVWREDGEGEGAEERRLSSPRGA